jgi:hypothetical protein
MVSKHKKFPEIQNETEKIHAPSDMALGARDRRRLLVLIFITATFAIITIPFIIVITLEPDRRHIDLLGPGRYFVSINIYQINLTYAALRGIDRVGSAEGGEPSTEFSSSSSSSDCDVRRRLEGQ